MEYVIAIWGIAAIAGMLIGALGAAVKRLDSSAWAAWGFFFPPSLIVLFLQPKNTGPRLKKRSLDDDDYARD